VVSFTVWSIAMASFRSIIDFLTLGSDRPVRRLLAYYTVLAIVYAAIIYFIPPATEAIVGDDAGAPAIGSVLLEDGLNSPIVDSALRVASAAELTLVVLLALFGTLALMLPVTWVYMSARNLRRHSQVVAQALIILPIVVTGIVFIVRDSLALAFSLAGVVAAVRFRTNMRDPRDLVFIFLSIAVGFAAGVQAIEVGALVSIVFNFVVLLSWRYDFGRSALAPSASAQWSEPLSSLAAEANGNGQHQRIPDRDLILALTPKKADALVERFERARGMVKAGKKNKTSYNAVLAVSSDEVGEAQAIIERVLDERTKRWKLDEVITHTGKPSEMYYLVRLGKSLSGDELITEIRANAADRIAKADLEFNEAEEQQQEELK
jgi:hypothetical protein